MSSRWITYVHKPGAGMTYEQLVNAHVLERRMERMRRYVVGGRHFAALPEDVLTARWVEAYRALAAAPRDAWRGDALAALECEFELRRIELPMHLVEAERARYREYSERMRRPTRAVWERAQAELAALRARLQQPKH